MRSVFLAFFALSSLLSYGQTEATTTNGKQVILYNDGTWEYKQEIKQIENIGSNNLALDKSIEGNLEELYFATSERLDRFFGHPQNKIRGKAQCFIDKGQAKLGFTWEVYLGDGNRYFGYLKEGTPLSLKLKQIDIIPLTLDENIQTDVREKYKVTIFKGNFQFNKRPISSLNSIPC